MPVSSPRLIKIGNSRGIRLSKAWIKQYRLDEGALVIEAQPGGLFIHKKTQVPEKLSWEDTYKAMACAQDENWGDWDVTTGNALDEH